MSDRAVPPAHGGQTHADWWSSKGEKVTIKAHGGPIDIEGVAVAIVNDKLQLQKVEVFFDPMTMFRQMAAEGGVTKEKVDKVQPQ